MSLNEPTSEFIFTRVLNKNHKGTEVSNSDAIFLHVQLLANSLRDVFFRLVPAGFSISPENLESLFNFLSLHLLVILKNDLNQVFSLKRVEREFFLRLKPDSEVFIIEVNMNNGGIAATKFGLYKSFLNMPILDESLLMYARRFDSGNSFKFRPVILNPESVVFVIENEAARILEV